jgi:hypothetical protein
MKNPYNRLVESLRVPLKGFGIQTDKEIAAQIAKNIKNPVGSDPRVVAGVFGTADEFMSEYENFEKLYRGFLQEEIQSRMISSDQRRVIQSAMDAPKIDLSLIKNLKNRKALNAAFGSAFDIQGIVENFGAPGMPMPSSNLFRAAGRYLVDQQRIRPAPSISFIKFNNYEYKSRKNRT